MRRSSACTRPPSTAGGPWRLRPHEPELTGAAAGCMRRNAEGRASARTAAAPVAPGHQAACHASF